MSFTIDINDKHKYNSTSKKVIATGNGGGNSEISNETISIEFVGRNLILKQNSGI